MNASPVTVLIADKLSDDGVKLLQAEPGLKIEIKTGLSPQQLAEVIGPYEGLIVRSSTKVTAEVLEKALRLRVIGRAGVGLDNVDAAAATKRGIIVMNVPEGNTISTAEHAMSLLLALARRIPQADAHVRSGLWERTKFVGTELFGKTLGVIGLGRVGREVARRCQAFGMRVVAHDPFLSNERTQQLDIELVDLPRLYATADFITIHTPLTAETRHLIGAKELAAMKQGARLINCARGGIVDEQALHQAITSGHLAGAALDVFEEEPPKHHPLLTLDQVVCTPHLGASTEEAQLNVAVEVAKQVADALLGRGIRNAVNMPSLDAQTLKMLQPYIRLGEQLGSLGSQLSAGPIATVQVLYAGELTQHDTAPITLAVLKGVLAPMVGENVNYVNAALIAAERGLKVVEAKTSRAEEFANLLSIELQANGTRLVLEGTLSARREPRVVKIDRFFVEAVPEGFLLILRNQDKPGLIGELGTLLGRSSINIAGMTNGRDAPGGTAITVLNIDQPVPPAVLEQVKKLRHVIDAKLISL